VEVEAGASEENEKDEKEEKEIDLTPGALSRTDDPVRLYLSATLTTSRSTTSTG
jgi:hypothetical protein